VVEPVDPGTPGSTEVVVELSTEMHCDCHCQVCHRVDDDDAVGWLPAEVKMMKGEFVVIDYIQATHVSVTDIVNVDLVRFPSKK